MTILQIILVSIGGLVLFFFLFSFFLPSTKQIERSIEIDASAKKLYNLVSDFRNYKKWNPWSAHEPEAKTEMTGTPNSIGHKWLWDGHKIGKGYLQIKKLEDSKSIVSDLIFEKPRKMKSLDLWDFNEIEKNKTIVKWGHKAYLAYPTGRIFGLMLEKMLAKDFEKGLNNLKTLSKT